MPNFESPYVRLELFDAPTARPVLLARRRRRAVAYFSDHRPVGEPQILACAFSDRIDDEFGRHAAGHDHGAAGQESRPFDRAAPQHGAVPARRTLTGIKRFAHRRMNTVGTNQNVAASGGTVRTGAIKEIGGDAGFILTEGAEAMAGMDTLLTDPFAHGVMDHAMQPAAMDRKLRHVIAGVEPARFAPDLLTEAIGIEQLIGAYRDRIEPLQKSECAKLLDRMRQRIDADAKLADLVGLLEHLALDAACVQHQRGGESANAAACDNYFHGGRRSDVRFRILKTISDYPDSDFRSPTSDSRFIPAGCRPCGLRHPSAASLL